MEGEYIGVQPLSYKKRRRTFFMLVGIFLISLPFLYLYATGYRIDYRKPTNLVSTGGMYIAVDRVGADIYIDNELVRETRTFRKAFYAQRIDAGTHRVHVQKDGYHTWVKELPVTERLVTEAEAFNLPLVPQVRVISEWKSATGTSIVTSSLLNASTTNQIISTTTRATTTLVRDDEFLALSRHFSTTSPSNVFEKKTPEKKSVLTTNTATTTNTLEVATTTIITNGVRLASAGEELYATWVGTFEQMPYYYCAPDFPRYSTSTDEGVSEPLEPAIAPDPVEDVDTSKDSFVIHPVQTVPADSGCVPTIKIDRKNQTINDFDFFPGSTDFVILALQDGIYVVEVDDRSWQNVQPLIMGEHLQFYIESNAIYVYDGNMIYQVMLEVE